MEERIAALSTAFDAYVELGDVREELAAFPDTSQARLQALRVIDALGGGRTATLLDHRPGDHWLTYAANALIARHSGSADEAAEARAIDLGGSETEPFWVATLSHQAALDENITQASIAARAADDERRAQVCGITEDVAANRSALDGRRGATAHAACGVRSGAAEVAGA